MEGLFFLIFLELEAVGEEVLGGEGGEETLFPEGETTAGEGEVWLGEVPRDWEEVVC